MTSWILARKIKILLYKILICPVLTYETETWPMSKKNENLIVESARGVLEKIFGSVFDSGAWRMRYNDECYDEIDIVKPIKINKLLWAGHIYKLEDTDPAKSSLH